jgi:predicted nucleotidyltransferase
MRSLKAREGDFLQTSEGLFFDVKGLVHPPDRIVAYLRYLEDPSGDRRRENKTYRKVYSLTERMKTLRRLYPQYLCYDPVFGEHMQEVPNKYVSKIFRPSRKTSDLLKKTCLDIAETTAIEFIHLLHDSSNVKIGKIGLSGSILVDLHTEGSDIDIVAYGRKNCTSIYEALKRLMKEERGLILKYGSKDLERLYEFRSKDTRMPLRDFIQIERAKYMQGKFRGRDFFMRFLLDWNEVDEKYGDRIYVHSGYAEVEARVVGDSDSIFTPSRYLIDEVKTLEGEKTSSLKEIASFRGRFCEQARKGDRVIARGKVEKVVKKDGTEYFRLVLGAKPSDYMIKKHVS